MYLHIEWEIQRHRKHLRHQVLFEHQIKQITLHHTATVFKDNRRGPRALRSIQSWHQNHPRKSLPDIAYHYIIDRQGIVYAGRDSTYRGDTHTNYDPTGHLLLCLMGNFEEQAPSEAQLNALSDLIAWAITRYGLERDDIQLVKIKVKLAVI